MTAGRMEGEGNDKIMECAGKKEEEAAAAAAAGEGPSKEVMMTPSHLRRDSAQHIYIIHYDHFDHTFPAVTSSTYGTSYGILKPLYSKPL